MKLIFLGSLILLSDFAVGASTVKSKAFLYFVEGEFASIRSCAGASKFPYDSMDTCLGPELKVPKKDFLNFLERSLIEVYPTYGPYNRFHSVDRKFSCENGEPFKNYISEQRMYVPLPGDLKGKIEAIFGAWQKEPAWPKSPTDECASRTKLTNAFESQILQSARQYWSNQRVVSIYPTLYFRIFQKFDPQLKVCGNAARMNLEQREKNCRKIAPAASSLNYILLRRDFSSTRGFLDYFLDKTGKEKKGESFFRIWGPEGPARVTYLEAVEYCEQLKDLGLKWEVPSAQDFAGLEKVRISGKEHNFTNESIVRALGISYNPYWTTTFPDPVVAPKTIHVFYGKAAGLGLGDVNWNVNVICVSKSKLKL